MTSRPLLLLAAAGFALSATGCASRLATASAGCVPGATVFHAPPASELVYEPAFTDPAAVAFGSVATAGAAVGAAGAALGAARAAAAVAAPAAQARADCGATRHVVEQPDRGDQMRPFDEAWVTPGGVLFR